jgi:ubiquinone/menaquinone biosynthesis C-methylase UbiE
MKATTAIQSLSTLTPIPTFPKKYADIERYYDIAGPDYEAWSRNFNMHFGYCRSLLDIFRPEKMLVNMNDEVLNRLAITKTLPATIADLGCGVGSVARYAAKIFPLAKITGITIVDSQIQKGTALIGKENLQEKVVLVKENFEDLCFEDSSFSCAYAIESACHAGGPGKELFIKEMARILKAGGHFSIADGFLKTNKQPRFFRYLNKKIIKFWALPCFGNINDFKSNLEKYGLTDIEVKEISWRIAPSVAYVPWTCLKFFVTELWRNKSLRMKKERWYNVYAPVLGMILGLYRKHFGYYLISGRKGSSQL